MNKTKTVVFNQNRSQDHFPAQTSWCISATTCIPDSTNEVEKNGLPPNFYIDS